MEYEKRKIIIDTDPGIDDAYAMLFALNRPELEVLGITTVSGNTHAAQGTKNALKILEHMGRTDIPVCMGCEKPLKVPIKFDTECHGDDGFGNCGLPEPQAKADSRGAVDFILKTLTDNEPGTVTIVALGPLTNIASAFMKDPDALKRVKEIFSMGGAVLKGNITPVAEYNYWADPDAAAIVYDSGIPIYMIGLNITEKVPLTPNDMEFLYQHRNHNTEVLLSMYRTYVNFYWKYDRMMGAVPHDLLAMAAALDPSIVEWNHCTVQVSNTSLTRGECLADLVDAWKQPKNCHAGVDVDADKFFSLFFLTMLPGRSKEFQEYNAFIKKYRR
jgi:purine nucleosidase